MIIISKRRKYMLKNNTLKFKLNSFDKAIMFIQKYQSLNFIESIDVSVNLGININKSDQHVNGMVVLPYGTGKNVKIIVFAKDIDDVLLKESGADMVGMEDLVYKIKNGFKDFNLVIATPESMSMVSTLGGILGPKGLMPNPKLGTVTNDIVKAVRDAKSGQIRFCNDKNGIIHSMIGKVNFDAFKIKENLKIFLLSLIKFKPISSRGLYIKKVTISSTMGLGYPIKYNDFLS
ncbi:50S ribosomal protein L1 [Candidatus Purcelliella pentastirinorum]|uniref:Large ribosomal subunit protein uL1 n=1 Tax=Candidatus Purcelliella pentastirinorum TaxID=472834 RepID=A0AAX3N767_9ENTR|nr:50S ribosomal protein L1 [Candidatus Purcelliella pentastirinorum]WDI78436.1 50S ribosomal protein L1 [Candidatus Purcelliella pentastirinorum]WDR80535.1 50S ribosomal protein L1 [Candidatus Purcelliella pentastirinorum]